MLCQRHCGLLLLSVWFCKGHCAAALQALLQSAGHADGDLQGKLSLIHICSAVGPAAAHNQGLWVQGMICMESHQVCIAGVLPAGAIVPDHTVALWMLAVPMQLPCFVTAVWSLMFCTGLDVCFTACLSQSLTDFKLKHQQFCRHSDCCVWCVVWDMCIYLCFALMLYPFSRSPTADIGWLGKAYHDTLLYMICRSGISCITKVPNV